MKDQLISLGKQLLASLGLKNLVFYGVNLGAIALGALGNLFDGVFGVAPILLMALAAFNIFFRNKVD